MPVMRKQNKQILSINHYEKQAWNKGFLACGIDEVGRGCLAGPLIVGAAVIIKPQSEFKLLSDSKLLTAKQRETSLRWVKQHCLYATSIISPCDIDRLNIYQATLKGMRQAFYNLVTLNPTLFSLLKYILVDAMPLTLPTIFNPSLEIYHFPKGEFHSKSIAAASIVAKVTRDRLMNTIDPIFPAFNLKKHKGYGTKIHQKNLLDHGPSIIHRTSFLKKIQCDQKKNQRQLFEKSTINK
jgi:ribonuclease HII